MTFKLPKVNYQVDLFERLSNGSVGERYCIVYFSTEKEVEEFLNHRASSEDFYYSVQLFGSLFSW